MSAETSPRDFRAHSDLDNAVHLLECADATDDDLTMEWDGLGKKGRKVMQDSIRDNVARAQVYATLAVATELARLADR